MEVKNTQIVEREIRAMDELLPSLYQKGLLTDIECRIIVCTRQLSEKQLALYRTMISKNKQTAAQLIEVFRAMNYDLHSEEHPNLQESDHNSVKNESNSPLEVNKNPMLNDTVIKCVFGFLPLEDIKNCRLVTKQWNSAAEILLRKRAKIHFRTDGLRPETFLAVSKFSLPKLPFSAFKFSELYSEDAELYWRVPELEDFFEKWGGNIEKLNVDNINIKCVTDPSNSNVLDKYDVTPWFRNASKITSLTIEGTEDDDGELNLSLSLGKLESLSEMKTFIMKGNSIEIFSEKDYNIRMVPVNIEMSNVTFKRDDEILDEFRYNDLFDFSQAVTLSLNNCEEKMSEVTFDMGDQVFKHTDLLYLKQITIGNWKKAKGYIREIHLTGIPFIEQNHLEIESVRISASVIDLFALPLTVERIEVDNCDISCSEQFSLPKLKFLKLHWDEYNSSQFKHFQLEKCEALKELSIYNFGDEATSLTLMFDVKGLLKNLQVLRIKGDLSLYLADECTLWMPGVVVLEDTDFESHFSNYARIAEKFLALTLVLVCNKYMKASTDDIVKFLSTIMKGESKKIIIGMKDEDDDLHSQTSFKGSWISRIVDAKSNHYEFENTFGIVGKAITYDQFINGCISVGNDSIPYFLKEE